MVFLDALLLAGHIERCMLFSTCTLTQYSCMRSIQSLLSSAQQNANPQAILFAEKGGGVEMGEIQNNSGVDQCKTRTSLVGSGEVTERCPGCVSICNCSNMKSPHIYIAMCGDDP